MTNTLPPRAPAVREKLGRAEEVLAQLEADVAALALDASEGVAGAEKALAAHRSRIEMAERQESEMRRAVALAERLDREAAAGSAVAMHAEQLAAFRNHVGSREKAMKRGLEHAAEMAKAFAEFTVMTEAMVGVLPSGTAFPVMAMGENGLSGNLLSSCEKLLLAEMFRLGDASNGRRAPIPFSKPQTVSMRDNPGEIPPGIEVLKAAHQAMLRDIEQQVAKLDAEIMNAATHGKAAA